VNGDEIVDAEDNDDDDDDDDALDVERTVVVLVAVVVGDDAGTIPHYVIRKQRVTKNPGSLICKQYSLVY
jgi:hypothetical protein